MVPVQEMSVIAQLKNALAVAGLAVATQAAAQVTFYDNDSFGGRSFTTEQRIDNFGRYGFNDRASSVVVVRNRWEVCEATASKCASAAASTTEMRISARSAANGAKVPDRCFDSCPSSVGERSR